MFFDVVEAESEDLDDDLKEDFSPIFVFDFHGRKIYVFFKSGAKVVKKKTKPPKNGAPFVAN